MSARPTLLALSECLPLPAVDGGRVRFLAILRALAGRFRVRLVSFRREEEESGVPSELAALCETVTVVPLSRRAMSLNVVRGLFSRRPANVSAYDSEEMRIAAARAGEGADAVWVNRLRMWSYAPPARARILDLTDSLARFAESLSDAPSARHRVYGRLDALRLRRAEIRAASEADLSCLASRVDVDDLTRRSGRAVRLLPNAVSASTLRSVRPRPKRPIHVLFVGSMNYAPNRWALTYLVRDVWPLVRSAAPDAELTVAGSGRGSEEALHAGARLVVDAPDLAQVYSDASVVAVSGRTRGGTRFKLLEAVAHGLPVVATSAGAEGLPFEHERHLLIADRPADFASAILRASDPRESQRLASAAQRLLRARLTWERVLPPIVREIEARLAR